jgi:hypothetical protein
VSRRGRERRRDRELGTFREQPGAERVPELPATAPPRRIVPSRGELGPLGLVVVGFGAAVFARECLLADAHLLWALLVCAPFGGVVAAIPGSFVAFVAAWTIGPERTRRLAVNLAHTVAFLILGWLGLS